MELEKRMQELEKEKRVAALEAQAQEQPDNFFSNYLLQCVLHYHAMMTKAGGGVKCQDA